MVGHRSSEVRSFRLINDRKMEKGIKSRRKILEVAFKLFAAYSYPDVSYSLLEEASGISRGSMVYYFNNKEGIFRAVLETFLFDMGSVRKVPVEAHNTLKGFYDTFLKQLDEDAHALRQFRIPNLCDARFTIERSALQFVPEFRQNQREKIKEDLQTWTDVMNHAKETGEIRSDVDTEAMANIFQNTFWGSIYLGIYGKAGTPGKIQELHTLFDDIYNLIKA